jgi:hypothetical protein
MIKRTRQIWIWRLFWKDMKKIVPHLVVKDAAKSMDYYKKVYGA